MYAFLPHPSRSTGSSSGDEILPMCDLKRAGYRLPRSLGLFNREHWNRDSLVSAKIGLSRIKKLIDGAGV